MGKEFTNLTEEDLCDLMCGGPEEGDGMTREEAVTTLKEHRIMFQHDFGWDTSTLEALEMAIRAMSVIEDIKSEIAGYKDNKIIHAERNEMIDIVLAIIDRHINGKGSE